MRFNKTWFVPASMMLAVSFNCYAENSNVQMAIDNGLRYLESSQTEFGEFPATFTYNVTEPERSMASNYESNLYSTVMIADAIHAIKNSRVDRMEKKVVSYLENQLFNSRGLWPHFTTHNPKPILPVLVYDLDTTALASMVMKENNTNFPNNLEAMKKNRRNDGIYYSFIFLSSEDKKEVDCGFNANIISYMQENDAKVCGYINEQIAAGKNCAKYTTVADSYYYIANAFGNGISCLQPSVAPITNYVISSIDKKTGSVGDSPYKTAIALNTLLSVHYQGPELKLAKDYLLKTQSQETGAWAADDFWLWPGTEENGDQEFMGMSSSSALTTALALKALNEMKS